MSELAPPLPAGSWTLQRKLGAGGMGEVWEGVHTTAGIRAAVKLLPSRGSEESARALVREVRAAAGLGHPGVVAVLDHDVAGARPWIAMELVAGSTLFEGCGQLPWAEALPILETLLEALAHAHSRGVLHLDVKPQNVLLSETRTGRSVKLGDFGLALLARENPARTHATGSPAYMAPEQFRAEWRRFGPPTDLYALGCLATHLVQGAPPFVATEISELRSLHLARDPRALRPTQPVPRELESWILRLLEKRPGDRYPTAAHALRALRGLGPAEGEVGVFAPPVGGGPSSDTFVVDDKVQAVATFEVDLSMIDRPLAQIPDPPFPELGRAERGLPHVPPPGTALWGLSRAPLVGREPEQEALWRSLGAAVRERRARVRVLRGEAGVGRSSLGRWVVERVQELGVAAAIPIPAAPAGASAARSGLARWARTEGLEGGELARRLTDALDVAPGAPVVALAASALEADGDPVAAWVRVVEELASRRPLVVWADDAHLDAEVTELVGRLGQLALPVLVLASARTSDPAADLEPFEAASVDWPAVDLRPLDPAQSLAVVERALGLDPVLAARVAERSAGNPALAESFVATWVRAGDLVPSEQGLALRPGTEARLPDGEHRWWRARLDRAIGDDPDGWRAAEIGAVLGYVVRQDELVAACRAAGVRAPLDLGERVIHDRLAARVGVGLWRFGGVGVRECLLETARESGRLTGAHAAVAASLEGQTEPARVARHLLGAGEVRRALPVLLRAARSALDIGDSRAAWRALRDWEHHVEELRIPPEDPQWARGWTLASEVWSLRGDNEAALGRAERALRACPDADRGAILVLRARARGMLGDAAGSEEDNRAALAHARACGDAEIEARALWNLSFSVRFQGRMVEAESLLRQSADIYRTLGTERGDAVAARGEASLALLRRDSAQGARLYAEAARCFRSLGRPIEARTCHYLASAVWRWEDALEPAWREGVASVQVAGGDRRPAYGLNLALIAWAMGKHDVARRELIRAANRGLDPDLRGLADLVFGAGPMGEAYRDVVQAAFDTVGYGGHHLGDLAWAFEHASREARAAGRGERALRLREIAVELWERWGASHLARRAGQR